MRDLLFEIGTEELPAGFLKPALSQLSEKFTAKAAELKMSHGTVRVMGTPRRLALLVEDVAEKQDDIREELLGPSKKASFDKDGNATRAAEGFARSKGAQVSDLTVVDTPKGEYLMLVREVKGKQSSLLLPEILQELILELTFAKSMRWGAKKHPFGRPIQWIAALFGEEIIPFNHEGIISSNLSRGHRFNANENIAVKNAAGYEAQLEEMQVIVDPEKRREMVLSGIKKAVVESEDIAAGEVLIDENLVDTVTNLVETPHGICGTFDEKFLQLPPQVLITSMREHQKYFPVVNREGDLLPGFVAVNNSAVYSEDVTRKGHQRVLRARLEDALFFFNADRKIPLESRIEKLSGIIFQAKLGTMYEKSQRLVKLVHLLAEQIDPAIGGDCSRAALLCKTDLLSEMVGEFPSLQGVMGAAYALNDGEKEEVAIAIGEHYMPKRAGADIPESDLGAILGLADRFDTLVGCFGIGQVPSGTADPFGLRRISLAILHIIEGKGYSLSLKELLHKALALYGDKVDGSAETVDKVVKFIQRRFSNDCTGRGFDSGAVEAVVSVAFDDVNDSLQRIRSFSAILNEPSFKVLAASYKRIRNIIKENRDTTVLTDLFESDAEGELYSRFADVQDRMGKLVALKEYGAALEIMLEMKEPVDTFFDKVMVMADDDQVRTNRLNLLT
ncbi:MAG: glycine--tRNA ligase subunit beta, partial [Deltaproteobacteria bacterium]|nr:glycine--tRNA ligase subunit beta [Deltaproteobacteria bacterium]